VKAIKYLTALLAGVSIHFSFAPYSVWLAGLIGLLLFCAVISSSQSPKRAFALAFVFATGLFGAGVSWVYVSIHTYGEVPMVLAFIFTAGFVLFLALLFALPWLLYPLIGNTRSLRLFCFPLFWLFSEWLRSWLLTGFPWLHLGYAHIDSPLGGWLPVFGVLGTGFLLAMATTAILYALTWHSTRVIGLTGVVLLAIFIPGIMLSSVEWTEDMAAPVPVTMVQPDIPLRDKWNPLVADEILLRLEELSEDAWQPGLLIWPEAAIPFVGDAADPYVEFLDSLSSQSGTAMITGLLTYDEERDTYLNSITGLGHASNIYHKQRLVPFGEYVPLENWLRGTMHFFNLPMSVIRPGLREQTPLAFDYQGQDYLMAPAICYEIAYDSLVRELAADSNMLVTLSNDAWFGTSIGPRQHMQIAQARARENQKPLLRVTNNGITALVDHQGIIVDRLPQFQGAALKSTVAPRTGQTPYSRHGNLFALSLAALLSLYAIYRHMRNRRFQTHVI
jgi:apolipoprotein N-acyltransferase